MQKNRVNGFCVLSSVVFGWELVGGEEGRLNVDAHTGGVLGDGGSQLNFLVLADSAAHCCVHMPCPGQLCGQGGQLVPGWRLQPERLLLCGGEVPG